jgi:DNA polymerase III delta prime subunit
MTQYNQEGQQVWGSQQNAGGNIINTIINTFFPTRTPALQKKGRIEALRQLRSSYKEMMGQSLQGITWLELGLTEKPDAVQTASNMLLRIANSAGKCLPPSTSIIEVYDKVEHALLILGEPGVGKTTLLLNLAQQLIERAEKDEAQPLPVLLSLSSWAFTRSLPLQDWIAQQAAEIYAIPQEWSKQWMGENGIVLLLDGLDEMEEPAGAACIKAINTYRREHLAPLVVCSRIDEYETTVADENCRLALQGAVTIQALTNKQVDDYLVQAGKPLAALHNALKMNSALRDLATTPLMLNILALTYRDTSMPSFPNKKPPLLQQVWDDYIQRMVERKGNSERYPLAQTIHWLSWLAGEMREHNQTEFWLERLQPEWLSKNPRRFYRWSIGIFFGVFVGVPMGRVFDTLYVLSLNYIQHTKTNSVPFGCTLMLGVIFGLIAGSGRILPVEEHVWSWKKAFAEMHKGVGEGVVLGLLLLVFTRSLIAWLVGTLILMLLCGLIKGLIHGRTFKQLEDPKERSHLKPNEGIRRSLRNGLKYGIGVWVCCWSVAGLAFWFMRGRAFEGAFSFLPGGWHDALVYVLISGLLMSWVAGMAGGLAAVIEHFVLRLVLVQKGLFPMQAVSFLEDAQARILLRRVGRGGYRFAHRLLLDHLANLSPRSASAPSPASNKVRSKNSSSV